MIASPAIAIRAMATPTSSTRKMGVMPSSGSEALLVVMDGEGATCALRVAWWDMEPLVAVIVTI